MLEIQMLLLILASAVFAATATLVEKPQNTFASEGHRVQLNCSTSDLTTPISWQYIPGAEGNLPKDVFLSGRLVNDYVRFQMYGNSAEGVYNLVIPSVELRDAGTYRCNDQDGAGERVDVILNVTTNAEFNLVPLFTEAVVGESAYFDCTTTTHTNEVQWYHYRVGAMDHEDICLYCMSKTHPQYENRIEVHRNSSTDTYRLSINSVQLEDAGSYICHDNGGIGDSILAQLVVLASAPICHTNMKPDGLLGPNSCNIDPEELQMSCNVVYHGNIKPMLQWREFRSLNSIKEGLNCSQTGFKVTCDVALKASFDLHGSSYVCETTRHNCSAGVVRIIHANTNNSVSKLAYGTKETVICSANSSQSCNYTWTWVDEGDEEVISTSAAAIIPSKSGLYKCEAECSIREKQCTVLSRQILVTGEWMQLTILSVRLVLHVALIVITCIFVIFAIKLLNNKSRGSSSKRKPNKDTLQEIAPLNDRQSR